ncbi:hypothetical protein BG015_005765 [Linnemannia schmuckeri]|uniref:Uncharacterized protein n=1 Tax=Linnemannia schmuckeri TaxID=64567 RepID=A0A9P5VC90_9FUNG|nr:hypothetical protein BG015_005765 [Linnemannia schmuckeri]
MSLFAIIELAEHVGSPLTPHDWSICVRVSQTGMIFSSSSCGSQYHHQDIERLKAGIVPTNLTVLASFNYLDISQSLSKMSPTATTAPPEPTDLELLHHLLQQCTNFQRLRLLGWRNVAPQLESWKSIARSGLPGILTEFAINLNSEVRLSASSFPPVLVSRRPSRLRKPAHHRELGSYDGAPILRHLLLLPSINPGTRPWKPASILGELNF